MKKMSKEQFLALFPNPKDWIWDSRKGLYNSATRRGHAHIHNLAAKSSVGKRQPVAKKAISNNSALRWYMENGLFDKGIWIFGTWDS